MSTFSYCRPDDPVGDHRLRDTLVQSLLFEVDYWETYVRRVGAANIRALLQGERRIGSLAVYRTGQWFGGNCVSMGGVAAVGVVPEFRGRGAAAFLMAELLRELFEDGTALSTLFASTQSLYRKCGYECAGSRILRELPLTEIGRTERSLCLTPITLDDPDCLTPLADERARRTAGNLARTPGLWERLVTVPKTDVHGYLLGPTESPQGYILYHQPSDWVHPTILTIRDMLALTPAALRMLWTFIHDHRSIIDVVRWYGPFVDPRLLAPSESRARVVDDSSWMTRIVNVRQALCERGYSPGESHELHLEIVGDAVLAENNGRFVLHVDQGRGDVRAGGRGDLCVDIGTLAPLYTGMHSATSLSVHGSLSGDPLTLQTADRIFAGPEPWMPEGF
ncbi:MAG: GNAT family N-acetyltransferase [Planctomycetaceae bacterium]|jgi:predicted acetyltransferase|nr:GNAT family N-acetyltransferase [Planctomycetaceae bacterium]MDP7273942.1 GNAT family N-acetyltransferase [Planctomycetaceae bacterium]